MLHSNFNKKCDTVCKLYIFHVGLAGYLRPANSKHVLRASYLRQASINHALWPSYLRLASSNHALRASYLRPASSKHGLEVLRPGCEEAPVQGGSVTAVAQLKLRVRGKTNTADTDSLNNNNNLYCNSVKWFILLSINLYQLGTVCSTQSVMRMVLGLFSFLNSRILLLILCAYF